MERIHITKEILIKEYLVNQKSIRTIAEEFNFSRNAILKKLRKFNIERRKKGTKYISLVDQVFGMLTVVERVENDKFQKITWKCKCECGNFTLAQSDVLKVGSKKSCGCLNKMLGPKNPLWQGYGEISAGFFGVIKSGAKSRNLPFNITIEQIWELFLKQERRCALTGLPLCFPFGLRYQRNYEHSASLDRIDSHKGYEIDNIQWVHKNVNKMKQDFNENYFFTFCHLIANLHPIDTFKVVENFDIGTRKNNDKYGDSSQI